MPHTTSPSQPAEPARAPIRDDWAYAKAAEIYAWVASNGRPTTCMDKIAAELRVIYCRGSTGTLNMLTDIQRDWGVLP